MERNSSQKRVWGQERRKNRCQYEILGGWNTQEGAGLTRTGGKGRLVDNMKMASKGNTKTKVIFR